MSEFTIYEPDLPERIGVSIKVLRDLRTRHLQEGVDWKKNGRGAVQLTFAAARKVASSLGVDLDHLAAQDAQQILTPPEPAAVEEKKPAFALPVIQTARYLRQPINQKMVIARLDGVQINVKLKKLRRFNAGQKIPVVHVHHNIWQMVRI